jgi:hypothetical protein
MNALVVSDVALMFVLAAPLQVMHGWVTDVKCLQPVRQNMCFWTG